MLVLHNNNFSLVKATPNVDCIVSKSFRVSGHFPPDNSQPGLGLGLGLLTGWELFRGEFA